MMANPVVFFEVTGRDGAELRRFYGDLFGWEFGDSGDPTYGLVTPQDGGIGGGIGTSRDGGGGSALFYVEVDDIVSALDRATALGGRRLGSPIDITGGLTIAFLADPEDHVVGLSMSAVRR